MSKKKKRQLSWEWVQWHTSTKEFHYGVYKNCGNGTYCSLLSEMEAKYFETVEACIEWTDNEHNKHLTEANTNE